MNHSAARKTSIRPIRLGAIALVATLIAIALASQSTIPVWAQIPAYNNPLIAPVPAPSAPAQLPAPVTTAVAPTLIQVPAPPTPSPTPVQRAFNCSCFGRATGTHWMGQVSSDSYFDARRAAISACLTYNVDRQPPAPVITLGSGSTTATGASSNVPPLAGAEITGLAAQQGLTLPGTLNFSSAEQLQMCSECTCD